MTRNRPLPLASDRPGRPAVPVPQVAPGRAHLWRATRIAGLVATAALLAGLLGRPETTLDLLWNVVVPLLPVVFLVNPALWRNVCPLASLNELTGDRSSSLPPDGDAVRRSWAIGVALLFALVPARHLVFNVDGPALAATIAGVGLLAVGLGTRRPRRSGFCNAICPVLPVEKLYGQAPLAEVGNARCATCSLCIPVGCPDLARDKVVPQTLGPARRHYAWLLTSYGTFAAAFPGFVLGYFLVDAPLSPEDPMAAGAWAAAAAVYGQVLGAAAISYLLAVTAIVRFHIPSRVALPLLGAMAFSIYYYFAAPGVVEALHGAPQVAVATQVVMIGVAVVWMVRAVRRAPAVQAA